MFAKTLIRIAKPSIVASRSIVSKTAFRAGGAGGHSEAHHDEHHDDHHEHLMFEGDFNKGTVFFFTFGGAILGTGLTIVACLHQQVKQGFIWKK